MRKKYWMVLVFFVPLALRAADMLVPWNPTVIDSGEQAEAEKRARAQALGNTHMPNDDSEAAWMKKFDLDERPEKKTASDWEESLRPSRTESQVNAPLATPPDNKRRRPPEKAGGVPGAESR